MLLSTTYFGPIQWFSKLFQNQGKETYIEACETFQKQTFRNRCVIATANGQLPLTVPVSHRNGAPICDTLISDHGNWRHLHWQALQTAYGESAFFEYYEDSLRPFFFDEGPSSPVHHKFLLDYNLAGAELLCKLLDIDVRMAFTEQFLPPERTEGTESSEGSEGSEINKNDWRYSIRPKNAPADPSFFPKEYYQVYKQRTGFLPNLSILDLLFNEGPQAILTLRDCFLIQK